VRSDDATRELPGRLSILYQRDAQCCRYQVIPPSGLSVMRKTLPALRPEWDSQAPRIPNKAHMTRMVLGRFVSYCRALSSHRA